MRFSQSLAAVRTICGICDVPTAGLQLETATVVVVIELRTLVSIKSEILHTGLRVSHGSSNWTSTEVVVQFQVHGCL